MLPITHSAELGRLLDQAAAAAKTLKKLIKIVVVRHAVFKATIIIKKASVYKQYTARRPFIEQHCVSKNGPLRHVGLTSSQRAGY